MKNKKILLGFFFSTAVIGYILVKLDWLVVWGTFSTLNWGWLILGFGVYLINYLLRTYRFQTLLQLEHIRFSDLMGVTSLYGMYLYLLPAKSGELSYPILLKSNFDISLPESAATLITARFFDFITIALFIPLILVRYWTQLPPWLLYGCLVFCGCVLIFGILLVILLRRHQPKIIGKTDFPSNLWIRTAVNLFGNLIENLRTIDQRRQYWRLWLVSVGIWVFVQTNFYIIVLSMGYHLSYFQMIIVSILMVPMTLLPIQGFANLGTHEIGWVVAFSIFGQPRSTSLAIAVSSHVVLLLFVLILGLLGSVLLRRV